ncbi:hypothetical protein [Gordonia neofelifaecis]|uniref:Uncharacterized protein n=1 Tax=Gordonia neofelifaecis NRRL B-59395 TaxID=644548 RepID=F1YKI9_9ACTN|nr:hypothetical protein [Gordonia neofelifaecis]EGD54633.1 hypothetical protein SCNU_12112 [Gordonia neofelifaecis NRRL B-59395]
MTSRTRALTIALAVAATAALSVTAPVHADAQNDSLPAIYDASYEPLPGVPLVTDSDDPSVAEVLSIEAADEHGPVAEAEDSDSDDVSAWWWMLLLLVPVVGLILVWLRGRNSYDYATFAPATGPGFPPISDERAARLKALADGTESSAAGAIARADKAKAAAAAAAVPARPGARVPSEGGAVPLPIGASRPLHDDPMRAPDGYPIKAVTESGLYYRPAHPDYESVTPDLWFATAPTADKGGFAPADG